MFIDVTVLSHRLLHPVLMLSILHSRKLRLREVECHFQKPVCHVLDPIFTGWKEPIVHVASQPEFSDLQSVA